MKRYNKSDGKERRRLINEFLKWIENQTCCISGYPPPSIGHHVISWQSSRRHWGNVVPLSGIMHETIHRIGRQTFNQRYFVDLENKAYEYTKKFLEAKANDRGKEEVR